MARTTIVLSALAALAGQAIAQCSWPGHCFGDPCSTWDDCADNLICIAGACAAPGGPQTCSWADHCIGASCTDMHDCSDFLTCHPEHNGCIVAGSIEAGKWPFFLDLSCYDREIVAQCIPLEGEDSCEAPPPVVVSMLKAAGEHFNIGVDNVNVEVVRRSDLEVLLSHTVSAVATEGKLGGYWEVETMIECPITEEESLNVYGYDVYSKKYRNEFFWVGRDEE